MLQSSLVHVTSVKAKGAMAVGNLELLSAAESHSCLCRGLPPQRQQEKHSWAAELMTMQVLENT